MATAILLVYAGWVARNARGEKAGAGLVAARVAPAVAAGAVSGVLGGSTSMGGPPAIFYLLGTERDLEVFRGTLLAFFLPNSLIRIGGFAAMGRVTPDVLRISAIALPAMAVGLLAGAWLRYRVREEVFRLLVLLILILTSVGVIVSASWSLR